MGGGGGVYMKRKCKKDLLILASSYQNRKCMQPPRVVCPFCESGPATGQRVEQVRQAAAVLWPPEWPSVCQPEWCDSHSTHWEDAPHNPTVCGRGEGGGREGREKESERMGGGGVESVTLVWWAVNWILALPLVLWESELAAFSLRCPRVVGMSHDYHMTCLTTPLLLKCVKRTCWPGQRSVPWCRPVLWECASRNWSPRGGEDTHLHIRKSCACT